MLIGKPAHLEVVDATANLNRGYIMMDDCRLSERFVSTLDWRKAYVPILTISSSQMPMMKYFASLLKTETKNDNFGLPLEKFVDYRQQITNAMIEPDTDRKADSSFRELSRMIYRKVDAIIDTWGDATPELKSFIHGFAEINWVRTHIYFDSELAKAPAIQSNERRQRFNPHYILTMPIPSTVCGGFSWMVTALSAHSEGRGKIVKIEGRLRGFGGTGPPDHSWNAIITPDGCSLFCRPDSFSGFSQRRQIT